MRRPLFRHRGKPERLADAATSALHMCQRVQRKQTPKHLPRRFAKTFGQPYLQYRMLMLLTTIIVGVLDWGMLQTFLSVGSIICMKSRQAVPWFKQWPRRFATALQQPHVQYHLMLLLAALLALLISWSMFFSTAFHLALALCPWQM